MALRVVRLGLQRSWCCHLRIATCLVLVSAIIICSSSLCFFFPSRNNGMLSTAARDVIAARKVVCRSVRQGSGIVEMNVVQKNQVKKKQKQKSGVGFGGEPMRSSGISAAPTAASVVLLEETPEKGKILVSKENFDVGDLVFGEEPIWKINGRSPQNVLDSFYALSERQRMRVLKLYCMPEERSRWYLTLGASGERLKGEVQIPMGGSWEEAWRVLLIYESNSVSPPGQEFPVVYGSLSRMSHSCIPNVAIGFSGRCEVKALRTINAGDELTHSYLIQDDLAAPCAQRQATLFRNWGFRCQCPRCLEEESMTAKAAESSKIPQQLDDDGLFQAVLEDDVDMAMRILLRPGCVHPDQLRPAFDKRQVIKFREGAQTRPLWMAARLGHVRVARVLIEFGAGKAVETEGGDDIVLLDRFLHVAVKNGHAKMVELLLVNGADPSTLVDGVTALGAAESAAHEAVLKALQNYEEAKQS